MKGKWGLGLGWASKAANLAEVQSSPICANRANYLHHSEMSRPSFLLLVKQGIYDVLSINAHSLGTSSSIPWTASRGRRQKSPHNCCSGIITSQAAPVTRPYKQVLHTNWWILENWIIYCHIQLDTGHKAADPFPLFIMSKPGRRHKDVKCLFIFPLPAAPSPPCVTANDNIPGIYRTSDTTRNQVTVPLLRLGLTYTLHGYKRSKVSQGKGWLKTH